MDKYFCRNLSYIRQNAKGGKGSQTVNTAGVFAEDCLPMNRRDEAPDKIYIVLWADNGPVGTV